jgi:hypothetical protein
MVELEFGNFGFCIVDEINRDTCMEKTTKARESQPYHPCLLAVV